MEKSEINRLVKHAKLTERVLARREMLKELEELELQLSGIKAILQGTEAFPEKPELPEGKEEEKSEEAEEECCETDENPEEAEQEVQALRRAHKVVLGVAGAQPRIGCTHTSIMLATYLQRMGFRVALMEYEKEGAFSRFESFMDRKIAVYRNVTAEKMVQVLNEKFYNFIVIDFGVYLQCDAMMFSRCDVKILLCGAKPWETEHMKEIFGEQEQVLRQINFVFNFTAETQQKAVRKEMERFKKIYFLPMIPDPFAGDEIGEVKEILEEYLTEPPENIWKKLKKIGRL